MTRNDAPRAHGTALRGATREASAIRQLSERAFQQAVIDLCRHLHLLIWHDNDSRRNAPGFPDLVVVGPGGVLYRELKSSTGRIRPEQQVWLDRLTTAGADAGVWRPDDWTNGTIRTELERTAS